MIFGVWGNDASLCGDVQNNGNGPGQERYTDPFKELYNWLAWKSTALFKPVLDSFHAPMHRLVLLAEAQTGVVYPEELYGLRIPAFSEVCGDEVKDTVVSVTVQRQAEADRHRVVVNTFISIQRLCGRRLMVT